jgi:hypothetical protein
VVHVNGKRKIDTIVKSDDLQPQNTKFGLYVRGKSKATFEYLYAIREHADLQEPADDTSYLDKIRGGYYGTIADRDLPYDWTSVIRIPRKKSTKKKNKKPDFYFDEFGAIVHEVREFDVKFTRKPVLHSRLYLSNDWSAICPEFRSSSSSAQFVIANISRRNCVINGEETYNREGGNQSVDHRLNVFGRTLDIDEEQQEVKRENKAQISARGEIEAQLESDWIQNREMAVALADWINLHWGQGVDEQSAAVFGNPLLEVGDMVAVDYPDKQMTAAEAKFFVVGVSNSFREGLETTVTLRRSPTV